MKVKQRESSTRQESIDKFGYDTKYAAHLVRLLNEVEQIMTEGDVDLQRNKEQLKTIRSGGWTEQQVHDYFNSKERELEDVYNKSSLPWGPDEDKIKRLLLDCLEQHYGNLEGCVVMPDIEKKTLAEIREVLDRHDRLTQS